MRLDSGLTINQRLAVFRRLCGLSQAKMAELMNMKPSTYSQMERSGKISSDMILRLSEVLGVDPMELFLGTEHKTKKTESDEAEKDNTNIPIKQIDKIDPFEVRNITDNEKNIIKIIRNLPRAKREEILSFIEKTAGFGEWRKKP